MNRENLCLPSLVEPGVKYFLGETLKQCKGAKNRYYNLIFNLSIGFFVIGGICIFLYVHYNGEGKKEERELKRKQSEEYMINMIHKIQTENLIKDADIIHKTPFGEIDDDNIVQNKLFI